MDRPWQIGDPACGLAIAWTLFSGQNRQAFRDSLPFDAATWAGGRGWVLSKALITTADPESPHAADARRVLAEVLVDPVKP